MTDERASNRCLCVEQRCVEQRTDCRQLTAKNKAVKPNLGLIVATHVVTLTRNERQPEDTRPL